MREPCAPPVFCRNVRSHDRFDIAGRTRIDMFHFFSREYTSSHAFTIQLIERKTKWQCEW